MLTTFFHLGCIENKMFSYQQMTFSQDEVSISAIFCIKQAAIIIFGYNFGSFKMFSISDMSVVYSSSASPDRLLSPVVNFLSMEPENDPKNFLYIWVVRGRNRQAVELNRGRNQPQAIELNR